MWSARVSSAPSYNVEIGTIFIMIEHATVIQYPICGTIIMQIIKSSGIRRRIMWLFSPIRHSRFQLPIILPR